MNLVLTGRCVIGDGPICGWPQVNEVFFEDNRTSILTVQDVALLVVRGDITTHDRNELDFRTRTGAIMKISIYISK